MLLQGVIRPIILLFEIVILEKNLLWYMDFLIGHILYKQALWQMGDRKGTGEKKIHKETYSQLQLLQGTGSKRTSGSAFLFCFVLFLRCLNLL